MTNNGLLGRIEVAVKEYTKLFDEAFERQDHEKCLRIEKFYDRCMQSLGVNPGTLHEYLCGTENGASLRECIINYIREERPRQWKRDRLPQKIFWARLEPIEERVE